jgi:ubiquinone/menaquinone biosynthesis C-methylase UbiE
MYDEREDFNSHKAEVEALVSILNRVGVTPSAAMRVLDLGGGQGMHVGYLSALFGEVYCGDVIDYSSLYGGEFLKLLDEKHRRNEVAFRLDRVAFHRTDAMNLFYRDDLFDCVVSINAFEHIPDPGRALDEMLRVTRRGGHVYVATDPIWTADTGSHFFHRVPEPWAHLRHDDASFQRRMREQGASEGEIDEYRHAMNRWRESDFARMVSKVETRGLAEVVYADRWSGVVDEAHRSHPNVDALASAGYTESELLLRGLRWVFRKRRATWPR